MKGAKTGATKKDVHGKAGLVDRAGSTGILMALMSRPAAEAFGNTKLVPFHNNP